MIPIFKPYMPLGIGNDLNEILYSGQLAYGNIGRKFEQGLADFISNDKVLTTATYNHALLMALSILGLKSGDEIIASPVSCLASNQPFAIKGLKIKWADVDPLTSTLDVHSVRGLITKDTKAIFNNIFCGFAGDLDEVYKVGQEFGIPVIDDCIEGFGTKYSGSYTGNLSADITVFSFQTVRLPNTIDGGALCFKENSLFEKAKKIRDYGINRSNFRLSNGEINPNCDITLEGYGGTMSELNSLIGLKQMDHITDLLLRQQNNSLFWNDCFSSRNDVTPLKLSLNCEPNYWVFGVLAENKPDFISEMKGNGFYATGVHINNNIYSVFENKVDLPGVNEFMKKFVAIPCGWWITNEMLERSEYGKSN